MNKNLVANHIPREWPKTVTVVVLYFVKVEFTATKTSVAVLSVGVESTLGVQVSHSPSLSFFEAVVHLDAGTDTREERWIEFRQRKVSVGD